MTTLPPDHFLAQPRPDVFMGPPLGIVDTTTVSAHDFDVDARTGFMPPQAPLERLPGDWQPWEDVLQDAIQRRLQLGEIPDLTEQERENSEAWRQTVRGLPTLPIRGLKKSEILLRRAHHVLAWIMHFYINTLPLTVPIRIPPPISIPLLQVSQELVLPPILTYSDDVLYNWAYLVPPNTHTSCPSHTAESDLDLDPDSDPLFLPLPPIPTIDNLKCLTLFTSTNDESEFYLASARIELAGVRMLELMKATMDEIFVGDDLALRRIAQYLKEMAIALREMTRLLLNVREGCDPEFFYQQIRPWFKGEDSMPGGRKWIFEGIETVGGLKPPSELSGPSAGQSALIHAIDVFLGVDHHSSHSTRRDTGDNPASQSPTKPPPSHSALLTRMRLYMPRHHRAFLTHLSTNPRPLRALVEQVTSPSPNLNPNTELNPPRNVDLLDGYNEAVRALREFRDAHLRIVATYIIGPSRRVGSNSKPEMVWSVPTPNLSINTSGTTTIVPSLSASSPPAHDSQESSEKGTGGTLLMPFLKSIRDRTAEAMFSDRQTG